MNEKLCSRRVENAELELWAALVATEGVKCQWQAEDSLDDITIQVKESPADRIAYPWNPAVPETDEFFTESTTATIFDGIDDAEISQRSQALFAQFDGLWAASTLETTLVQRFAAYMPRHALQAIAYKAQTLANSAEQAVVQASTTLVDQLVQCVREVVPGLADDDFCVLARPLAGAMRNSNGTNAALEEQIAQYSNREWEQLSELQRAKLSLAIARVALEEARQTA